MKNGTESFLFHPPQSFMQVSHVSTGWGPPHHADGIVSRTPQELSLLRSLFQRAEALGLFVFGLLWAL